MTVTTAQPTLYDPETLVPAALFDKLAARVERDAEVDRERAERIMRQALAFLLACARNPEIPLAPSRAVDHGWHAFILHTREYADFCARVAGHFIHHAPEEPGGERVDAVARNAKTTEVMRRSGLPVDEDLWDVGLAACSANCERCCSGGGHQGTDHEVR
jgi:hypothetical protein